jgi:hypothetical protein
MEVLISASMSVSEEMSTGMEIFCIVARASERADLKALIMTTGWIFRSSRGKEYARISPASQSVSIVLSGVELDLPRMMTLVVPSPTSSSCVRESSIMDLAAG